MTSQEEGSDALDYEGRDLEALASADNYHRWIADLFRPFLGSAIVELGAGSGNFSAHLVNSAHQNARITLIEPAKSMFGLLDSRFANSPQVRCVNRTLETAVDEAAMGAVDTLVAVNVLEHIEDDAGIVSFIADLLEENGTLCLFVPALPFLYSRFDETVGHFRRYTARSLAGVVSNDSRLRIEAMGYMDLLGVLPWWLAMKVMRRSLSGGSVGLYDRIGVPVTRTIERIVRPPIGKNLYLVARRT